MAIKLQEVIAERKYSEAEKPGDNWHFIADFLHLLSAPSVPVVALEMFVTLSLGLDAVFKVVSSST